MPCVGLTCGQLILESLGFIYDIEMGKQEAQVGYIAHLKIPSFDAINKWVFQGQHMCRLRKMATLKDHALWGVTPKV